MNHLTYFSAGSRDRSDPPNSEPQLTETNNPSIRFASGLNYAGGVILPAMVAALLSPQREVTAVQVTWLDPREPRKANVATQRKTFGAMGTGAVRLGRAGEFLGIAEGVETGASAMQLAGVPVWCCLGAARMQNVCVPSTVRQLHIFADDDEPGREAARRTAEQFRSLTVVTRLPPPPHKDWNDVLQARNASVSA